MSLPAALSTFPCSGTYEDKPCNALLLGYPGEVRRCWKCDALVAVPVLEERPKP